MTLYFYKKFFIKLLYLKAVINHASHAKNADVEVEQDDEDYKPLRKPKKFGSKLNQSLKESSDLNSTVSADESQVM